MTARESHLKVYHLMNSLRASGMERMFVSAAPYFVGPGMDHVVIGQGDDHPFSGQLESAGYGVSSVPALSSLRGMAAFLLLLRREKPSVLHIHSEGAYLAGSLIARFARIPVVRTIHNIFPPDEWSRRQRIKRRLEAFLLDGTSQYVSVSEEVRSMEARAGRESTVIMNWVDPRFLAARGCEEVDRIPKLAVIVGNASPIKRQVIALRAIWTNGWALAYHGDESGATVEELQILSDLEKAGRMHYRGTGDPLQSLLRASVYLMPSKKEGMSIALAEAVVVGIPCIVSDSPGSGWASCLPHVRAVVGDDWDDELANPPQPSIPGAEHCPDLSPARGARAYAAVYREAVA